MSVAIRRARAGDEGAIHALIVHLATYERKPDAVAATPASLAATLFGPDPRVFVDLAEAGGEVVGLALWFLTYSTWTGRPTLYLEDLIVTEAARGTGAGRALVAALAREAVRLGCGRIDWAVLDWNEEAMAFYRRMGAHPSEGWQPWRLDGEALARLAEA